MHALHEHHPETPEALVLLCLKYWIGLGMSRPSRRAHKQFKIVPENLPDAEAIAAMKIASDYETDDGAPLPPLWAWSSTRKSRARSSSSGTRTWTKRRCPSQELVGYIDIFRDTQLVQLVKLFLKQ